MSIIKNNLVGFLVADGGEKGELKMKATPTMLLKTHVEKMSVWATPTIFMKTIDLSRLGHDIYEKNGSYAPRSIDLNALGGSTRGAGVNPAAAHFRQREQKNY